MSFFDKRPKFFQLLFALLALVLVGASLLCLSWISTTPTDENVFVDASSFLYVTQDRGAEVRVGDLLLAIEDQLVASFPKLRSIILNDHPTDSLLTLTFFRGTEARKFNAIVPRNELAALQLREIPSHVRVTAVPQGGASDRAGMQVGDLILRINGKTFNSATQADSILRSGETGKNYTYTVLRNNKELELFITLASIGVSLRTVAFVLMALLCLALSFFLAANRPGAIGARTMAIAWLLLGVAFLVPPINISRFILIALSLCFSFGTAVLCHALHYFPLERPELISRPWFRRSLYALALVPLPGYFVGQAAGYVIAGYVMVLLYALLFFVFRKQRTPEYVKRIRPFTIATNVTLLFAVLLTIAGFGREGLPLPAIILYYSIPLSIFYIIARYREFDLTLRVRKNVQFSFASAVWVIVLAALFVWTFAVLPYQHLQLPNIRLTTTSIEVLSTPLQPQEQTLAEKTALMIIAVLLAMLFWRVGRWGYDFLTKRFYRGAYDYRRAANEMAEVMGTNLNMEGLAEGIAEKLSEMMQLKRVGIMFFRNQLTCCCEEAYGFDGNVWSEFCIANRKQIAKFLQPSNKEIGIDSLPIELRTAFRSQNLQIIVPIRSKAKLIGALLIGEKRSETSFREEDYEFLSSTAKQASVAIENSFLYEELAEQERMKHELGIARQIQLGSLPQNTPTIPGLEIAGISIPAFEVGGDYFDYLNGKPDKLTVIVGDVSGKGTSAALYMSKVQGIFHSLHSFGLSPRELFIRANTVLCHDLSQKSFVTALGAAFNVTNHTMTLARAGHLPLFHFDNTLKQVRMILPKGLGMGMSGEGVFADNLEERIIHYAAGDVFVFVTDGITEGRQLNNDEFGDGRLVKLLTDQVQASASEIRDNILAAVKEFAGNAQQHDDQTVVVVKAV